MKNRTPMESVTRKRTLAATAEHLAEWIREGRPYSEIAAQLSLLVRDFASGLPADDLQVVVDYLGAQIQTQVIKSAGMKKGE